MHASVQPMTNKELFFALISGQCECNNLQEVPQSIENFYTGILSDLTGRGQDSNFIAQTIAEDWQLRPNLLNPKGDGPTRSGVKTVTNLFNLLFSDFKFERQQTIICGNKVAVRSKFSGTIRGPPPGKRPHTLTL